MKQPKFFIGPMTQNVIDSCIEFSNENNFPLGFILSRRQIDDTGGYVGYKTEDFIKYVRSKTSNILICRDHSGIGQGRFANCPIEYEMNSFKTDAINNMDIIHIDPFKRFTFTEAIRESINNIFYINSINKNTLFEIGTEEAISRYTENELYRILHELKFNLGDIFNNVKYAVIQSGTKLLGTKNIGKFNENKLKSMVEICKNFNVLSKEHNGDYLTNDDIKFRFDKGLDAINIAPEFGVIETRIILEHVDKRQFFEIFNICLEGKKWQKWVDFNFDVENHKKEIIEISGHYHNKEIKEIVGIDDNIIKEQLKKKLQELSLLYE